MTAPFLSGRPFGFGSGQGRPVIPGPGTLPGAASVPPVGRVLELPLPEVFPVPDATQFNTLGSAASVGAEANTILAGASVTVPGNMLARISGLNIDITDMVLGTVVTWSLLINKQPQQGFSGLSIFPRVSPFVSNAFDVFLRFNGPAVVEVEFTNADGGTYTIGASVSGWFWPVASDQRWKSGGV